MPESDTITPLQVALLLGVSPRTVTRWADNPKHPLAVAEYTEGGQRRFDRAAVEALRAEYATKAAS
jgi:excisionase family DNA binding protein